MDWSANTVWQDRIHTHQGPVARPQWNTTVTHFLPWVWSLFIKNVFHYCPFLTALVTWYQYVYFVSMDCSRTLLESWITELIRWCHKAVGIKYTANVFQTNVHPYSIKWLSTNMCFVFMDCSQGSPVTIEYMVPKTRTLHWFTYIFYTDLQLLTHGESLISFHLNLNLNCLRNALEKGVTESIGVLEKKLRTL
jgi:hypothetical protein